MKKTFLFLFCICTCFLVFSVNCFAQDVKQLINGGENLDSELSEIEKSLSQDLNSNKELLKQPLDYDSGYKVYEFTNHDIVAKYNTTKNISSMISDNFSWNIPTTSGDLATIKYDSKNNIWNIIGVMKNDSESSKSDSSIINKDSLINKINSKSSEISEFKYVNSSFYRTTFAYFKIEDQEFLIPFGTRPDLTGLENEKIYEAYDVIKILDALDTDFNVSDSENANSGIGASSSSSIIYSPIILIIAILAIPLIVIVASVVIYLCIRKRTFKR